MNKTRIKTVARVSGISAAVLVVAFGAGVAGSVVGPYIFPPQPTLGTSGDGNAVVTSQEQTVAAVYDAISPSVVSIVTQTSTRSFYRVVDQEGAGTGVIVSSSGYVMTNNHVIDGAKTVRVMTTDGKTYENVEVIGRDPLNDVAFLKITSDDTFTAAAIGDSSTLRIGQQVVAVGNALGQYKNTVTSGIISGTGRPVTASTGSGKAESLTDLLQTDASINSGNSGGPLLNLAGQLIGINTAVASGADGIGFAIPINATKGVLAEVLESGTIKRAYMGVAYTDITAEVVTKYSLSVRSGAYIYSDSGSPVVSGSPAEKAGIKKGDIVQKVNDAVVGEDGGLSTLIGQYRAGTTVKVTLLRDGQTHVVDVMFTAYED